MIDLLVDADSLGFCDSTGLRVLISARRRLAERSGELQLLRTSGCPPEAAGPLRCVGAPTDAVLHDYPARSDGSPAGCEYA